MPENISLQILSQTSENIQKLFDLGTRIDERVKMIQGQQDHLNERLDSMVHQQIALMQKIAVLEAKMNDTSLHNRISECEETVMELDKQFSTIQTEHGKHAERWKSVASFVVQLIWVILAAYLLTKLHLQAPAVP